MGRCTRAGLPLYTWPAASTLPGGTTRGAEDDVGFHDRAIHDHGLHADQHAVVDSAAVQRGLVADGDVVADDEGKAVGVVAAGVGDVEDAAVLHGNARADADAVHVAANDGIGPDRAILADDHVADNDGCGIDEYTRVKLWPDALV